MVRFCLWSYLKALISTKITNLAHHVHGNKSALDTHIICSHMLYSESEIGVGRSRQVSAEHDIKDSLRPTLGNILIRKAAMHIITLINQDSDMEGEYPS